MLADIHATYSDPQFEYEKYLHAISITYSDAYQ